MAAVAVLRGAGAVRGRSTASRLLWERSHDLGDQTDRAERLRDLPPGSALVSDGRLKNPDGSYTAERKAPHMKIVEEIFARKKIEGCRRSARSR